MGNPMVFEEDEGAQVRVRNWGGSVIQITDGGKGAQDRCASSGFV